MDQIINVIKDKIHKYEKTVMNRPEINQGLGSDLGSDLGSELEQEHIKLENDILNNINGNIKILEDLKNNLDSNSNSNSNINTTNPIIIHTKEEFDNYNEQLQILKSQMDSANTSDNNNNNSDIFELVEYYDKIKNIAEACINYINNRNLQVSILN